MLAKLIRHKWIGLPLHHFHWRSQLGHIVIPGLPLHFQILHRAITALAQPLLLGAHEQAGMGRRLQLLFIECRQFFPCGTQIKIRAMQIGAAHAPDGQVKQQWPLFGHFGPRQTVIGHELARIGKTRKIRIAGNRKGKRHPLRVIVADCQHRRPAARPADQAKACQPLEVGQRHRVIGKILEAVGCQIRTLANAGAIKTDQTVTVATGIGIQQGQLQTRTGVAMGIKHRKPGRIARLGHCQRVATHTDQLRRRRRRRHTVTHGRLRKIVFVGLTTAGASSQG